MKKNLENALARAADYFVDDHGQLIEIARIQKNLEKKECFLKEAQNVVCNLSLIVIAETGFDLHEKSYFNIKQ